MMGAGESVAKAEVSTQTELEEAGPGARRKKGSSKVKEYPPEILAFTPGEGFLLSCV